MVSGRVGQVGLSKRTNGKEPTGFPQHTSASSRDGWQRDTCRRSAGPCHSPGRQVEVGMVGEDDGLVLVLILL